jgi:hypothetical protein
MALVLIRVRNQPARERYRTGLSREQMCLWFAGYPKRRAAMSGLGNLDLRSRLLEVCSSPTSDIATAVRWVHFVQFFAFV